MNRSELIDSMSKVYPHLEAGEVDSLIRGLFGFLSDNIIKDNRIEVRGFGCFSLKKREAGTVRNPRYGTTVEVDKRSVVYFRAGKDLKERVDYNK